MIYNFLVAIYLSFLLSCSCLKTFYEIARRDDESVIILEFLRSNFLLILANKMIFNVQRKIEVTHRARTLKVP